MASISILPNAEENPILVEGNRHVKTVTLNRPRKFNALNHQMILELLKTVKAIESNPDVKLVMIKAKGKAFCAGGDATALVQYNMTGHWTFGTRFYKKQLMLDYMIATCKKPQVFLINGVVMGGGAGLSMNGTFRIVTGNTIFAMPEATIGLFPDVGASYFLSKLPGFFGEYVGLTGAKLDGADMLACGLATHFVFSKDLNSLEESLKEVDKDDPTIVSRIINQYRQNAPLREGSSYRRLDVINRCFSKGSVEEIISSLEQENLNGTNEWFNTTIKSIKTASPISLKLFLRSIREGRNQSIEECLMREYRMTSHAMRTTVSKDFYQGVKAKLVDKNNSPKWSPEKLELVSNEMLDKFFTEIDHDEDWEDLKLPFERRSSILSITARL